MVLNILSTEDPDFEIAPINGKNFTEDPFTQLKIKSPRIFIMFISSAKFMKDLGNF
jgi:hypothetical protein